MELDKVIARIHEPGCIEALRPHWEESIKSLSKQEIPFLRPDEIHNNLPWTGIGANAEPILQQVAGMIRGDPVLRALVWHCERQIFEYPERIKGRDWPTLEPVLGDLSGVFYLLAAMAVVPRTRTAHRSMGVSEQVTRDTCRIIESFCSYYQKAYQGRIGIFPQQLFWLRRHASGVLFRIGRLEYYLTAFADYAGGCEVFRNRETGQVVALAADGQKIDSSGWRCGEADPVDHDCWTTSLTRTSSSVTGNPISPWGHTIQYQATLPLDQWEQVLGLDDTVLSMHIPAGGGLTPEVFAASMRDAIEFFGRHFPDQLSAAIACQSWIFSPILEGILPETSNLVRNMREVYLWTAPRYGPYEGLWFLFVQTERYDYGFDPETAEAHTSLQHAVLDYVKSGKEWRGGGMFFLNRDIEHFGTQYYRSHWPRSLPK